MRLKKRTAAQTHVKIKAKPLAVKNAPREEFMKRCNQIPLLGYHVETLSDGTQVCITKPGGKSFVDFQVWVVTPNGKAWRPGHGEIYEDLQAKCQTNATLTKQVIKALRRVHDGQEPDEVLKTLPANVQDLAGYPVDLILKVYKWIFGQEDCNYPPPKQGRTMSMKAIEELGEKY